MRGYLALGAIALLAVAGCGAGGDAEAGFGVPRQNQIDEVTSDREPVNGVIDVAGDGCMNLELPTGETRWIVWPPDAEQGDSGDVVLSGGQEFGDGDAITGVGALVSLGELPDGSNADSYFSSFGAFCDADEAGVAVLDWLEHADG
ncbi:hypothetical protein QQX13_03430 [Demequina sp. SYSU T00068]|uniref:hypothetical protein n=1 Tax=Demequina lignilytica TaxID=3051663 RepID=UPI00262DDF9C|nr:hypothetical protein [Demequina sp. SYSU T00068]MDN4489876.1 hypothetical protein [Demequina sp. SYSU T00068]